MLPVPIPHKEDKIVSLFNCGEPSAPPPDPKNMEVRFSGKIVDSYFTYC